MLQKQDELADIRRAIVPPDNTSMKAAQQRLDNMAKLPGSLGELETAIVRLAGLQGTGRPSLSGKTAVVFCADNGVVAEGVSPSDAHITAAQAVNFARGGGVVNAFARRIGAHVLPIDIGIATEYDEPGVTRHTIRRGTGNIAVGEAMSREECLAAIRVGVDTAVTLRHNGCRLMTAGEMGIGNTTTASAVASVLLGVPPEKVTGRGGGTPDRIGHKVEIIKKALEVNRPDADDPIDILSKVGGLDMAAMCGLYLGGALTRTAVMLDGMISSVAALCAVRLIPAARCALFPSHCSAEPAGRLLLEALNFHPLITAGLCLGEGTGGLLGAQLIEDMLAAYNETAGINEI